MTREQIKVVSRLMHEMRHSAKKWGAVQAYNRFGNDQATFLGERSNVYMLERLIVSILKDDYRMYDLQFFNEDYFLKVVTLYKNKGYNFQMQFMKGYMI